MRLGRSGSDRVLTLFVQLRLIDKSKERLDGMAAKAAEQIVSGAYLAD
jgi:hypothetical protein